MRLVQEADLCVVDLTDRNPNVFYECGRRHETGKPAILVIRKGEKIAFDLAGIRTISYDLDTPRSTRESVKLEADEPKIDSQGIAAAFGAIVQFYLATDRELEGTKRLRPLAEKLLLSNASAEMQAFYNNQMQMLMFGGKAYNEALEYAEKAVTLDPDEAAYAYNISLVYEQLDLPRKALDAIELCLKNGTRQPEHLAQAYDIYVANSRTEDAEREFCENLSQLTLQGRLWRA